MFAFAFTVFPYANVEVSFDVLTHAKQCYIGLHLHIILRRLVINTITQMDSVNAPVNRT